MIEVTAPALAGHPFLRGMPPSQLDALAAAASDVTFPAGHRIFEEGGFAGKFWLIQSGHVALHVHVPGSGRVIIDSIGIGDLLGCSWLFPPYRWAFGRRASPRCGRSSSTRPPFARGARPTRSSAPSSASGCGCSAGGCRAPGPS